MMKLKIGVVAGVALLGAAMMTPGVAEAAQRKVLMENFTGSS